MPWKAGAVANYFLDKAAAAGEQLTQMKLQKLVYYAHGWHLAFTGQPLIDELVEAWQWGPVIPSLYREFVQAGRDPIRTKAKRLEVVDGTVRFAPLRLDPPLHPLTLQILDRAWQLYGKRSAAQLSAATHRPGTPWSKVWDGMGPVKLKNKDIPNEEIAAFFKNLRDENVRRSHAH